MPRTKSPPSPEKTPRSGGGGAVPLSKVLADLPHSLREAGKAEPRLEGITADSRQVTDGSLFVAVRGERTDGHDFLEDAIRRGAAAAVVETPPRGDPGVPIIQVDDSRRALAQLAASWHERPADALTLVGITGTVGKTSTLAMLEAILAWDHRRVGTIGSLGLRVAGKTLGETGYTAPDPVLLHRSLAQAVEAECELAIMEATSHALVQGRIAGIRFDLGILTNLLPLEHQDYHGSFRGYVEAKRRFFDHLEPCTPLVFNVDNRAARKLVHDYEIEPIGVGTAPTALVRIEVDRVGADGTTLTLNLRRPVPLLDGGMLEPLRLPMELRMLGRSNVGNAALAATAALSLGVEPNAVPAAIAAFPPPPRRMEVVHRGRFTILDDTVGHPDSISAHFEVVEALAPRRVHVVFAVRGQRGRRINAQSARALAIWCARVRPASLIVTRSAEATDLRNRVEDAEQEAFCGPLRRAGIRFAAVDRLEDAVERALQRARDGDAVLLLGAQGMDQGQAAARAWLRSTGEE